MELLSPTWPAPPRVRAFSTTRQGGISAGAFAGLNLGRHVGDDPRLVALNRQILQRQLPGEPYWLEQCHGTGVINPASGNRKGDASFSCQTHTVCAVMTADCLPLLFCDIDGSRVAAVHAGWRGLAAGIIEKTVEQLACPATKLMAWLGPAIGPRAFEVGEEVRRAFVNLAPEDRCAFMVSGDRFLADIYQLARLRLQRLGINRVYGGDYCTFHQEKLFFSYRRNGQTGRMATGIWLADTD